MKNIKLTFEDFQLEKINKEAQKIIRGGDGEDVDPKNNPAKGTGGNGNG
ncbi:rSAM-modified peptide [Flavobacterium sp. GSB-24]|jgi:hypothetical protein|nr:rSAM-modified peptide [Flavobacterium sp. GSB-24]BDU24400.1 hypothetical protein FLGSB24_11440 [Flavobacterium sp. GSB-24]